MNIITIIIVLLIISFLVVIHELGHFWAAKKNGVRVEEFGIGYPPKIFGKQFGETFYSINLIPFGGFVKITGEDEEEDEGKTKNDPRSFANKSAWQKIMILGAGVFMNFMTAFLLYYIFFFANNFRSFYIPMIFDHDFRFGNEIVYTTMIFDMGEDSPSMLSGMGLGEVVLKVDGQDISNIQDLRNNLSGKAGNEVQIETLDISDRSYERRNTYTVVPESYVPQNEDEGDAIIGVYLGDAKAISYETPFEKIFSAPLHTYNMLSYSTSALGKIIGISVETRDIEPVSSSMTGPVGIFNILGSIVQSKGSEKFLVLIDTVAIVSLGFAFTNLLPIPALDGGRIAFKFFEGVTKRKVNPKFEASVHRAGMIALLLLVVLITFRDIRVW
ncbi:site-2 protease family protein [Patescibacteria group bacterium]|nr:site-2 protease family protein [Patescibacteria group bacterium]